MQGLNAINKMKNSKVIKAPKRCYATFKDDDYKGGLYYEKIHYFIIHDLGTENSPEQFQNIIPITLDEINQSFTSKDSIPQSISNFNDIKILSKSQETEINIIINPDCKD